MENSPPNTDLKQQTHQWGPIKAMRNLVAHNYGSMSREIIWETAIADIPVLCEFCEQQLQAFQN